jgi:hypothetical protein
MADPYEERLAALEAAEIAVSDLPWSHIKRKLEQDWQPDAHTLLAGGSLTVDMLSGALTFGSDTVTWGGASPSSANLSVLHGLGRVPAAVLLTSRSNVIVFAETARTISTFQVSARTVDGSSPAAATTVDFYWLAI